MWIYLIPELVVLMAVLVEERFRGRMWQAQGHTVLESRVLSPGLPHELTRGPASNNQRGVGKSDTDSRGPGT